MFEFDINDNDTNNYQCMNFELICTKNGNQCESIEQLQLGHRIVILKGSPIYCDDELIGLVSKAVYESGYLEVYGLHNFDKNTFYQQEKEILIQNSIKNVNGFQSLRNIYFQNL